MCIRDRDQQGAPEGRLRCDSLARARQGTACRAVAIAAQRAWCRRPRRSLPLLATLYFDRPRPGPAQSMPWTALSPTQEVWDHQGAPKARLRCDSLARARQATACRAVAIAAQRAWCRRPRRSLPLLATLWFDRPRPGPAQSMPWTALSPKQEVWDHQGAPEERLRCDSSSRA